MKIEQHVGLTAFIKSCIKGVGLRLMTRVEGNPLFENSYEIWQYDLFCGVYPHYLPHDIVGQYHANRKVVNPRPIKLLRRTLSLSCLYTFTLIFLEQSELDYIQTSVLASLRRFFSFLNPLSSIDYNPRAWTCLSQSNACDESAQLDPMHQR